MNIEIKQYIAEEIKTFKVDLRAELLQLMNDIIDENFEVFRKEMMAGLDCTNANLNNATEKINKALKDETKNMEMTICNNHENQISIHKKETRAMVKRIIDRKLKRVNCNINELKLANVDGCELLTQYRYSVAAESTVKCITDVDDPNHIKNAPSVALVFNNGGDDIDDEYMNTLNETMPKYHDKNGCFIEWRKPKFARDYESLKKNK